MKLEWPFQAVEDASPAQWVIEGLDSAPTVASVVPWGFDAYVRICHPAWRMEMRDGGVERRTVRWSEVAAETDRTAHRRMEWRWICGKPPIDDPILLELAKRGKVVFEEPTEGTLPVSVGVPVLRVLERHTSHPDRCWFALWSGYGLCHELAASVVGDAVREWLLFRGPLTALTRSFNDTWPHRSANMVWPCQRNWLMATEIDFNSTYIGGSFELIQELVGDSSLEAHLVYPGDSVSIYADTVNPHDVPLDTVCVLDESIFERYWPKGGSII